MTPDDCAHTLAAVGIFGPACASCGHEPALEVWRQIFDPRSAAALLGLPYHYDKKENTE